MKDIFVRALNHHHMEHGSERVLRFLFHARRLAKSFAHRSAVPRSIASSQKTPQDRSDRASEQRIGTLTVRIKHSWNVEILLSDIERGVEVLQWIVLGQLGVVDQIGSMAMDKGTECQTILWRKGQKESSKLDLVKSASTKHPLDIP